MWMLLKASKKLRISHQRILTCVTGLFEIKRCCSFWFRRFLLVRGSMEFDLCVVGAGMIGSSAARHATLLGQSVCLIGPEEPTQRRGHEIFAAHYDEGRITRSTASDPLWSILSVRSIARYRQLEKDSGIPFYHEVGCLTVDNSTGEYFKNTYETAKVFSPDSKILKPAEIATTFPYLAIHKSESSGIYEQRNAGYINPRRLVEVEQKLAQNGGCRIIRDIAKSIIPTKDTRGSPVMKVTTDSGTEIVAKKVLLATGAFTEFRALLPRWVKLDLQPVTQSVIFAELSEEDQIKLKGMPSMLVKENHPSNVVAAKQSVDYDCYILPPIKYPDGKVYLKLGHGDGKDLEKPLASPAEIADWFVKKVPEYFEQGLKRILHSTFKDLKPVSYYTDSCATVNTPNKRPYMDLVTPQLGVVLGDNGCSAKSCDELGRLAAHLIVKGVWEDDETKGAFNTVDKENARINNKSKL